MQAIDRAHEHRTDPAPEPLRPGLYQHRKGGIYDVLGVGEETETRQEYVVYRYVGQPDKLWARKLEMFRERFVRLPDREQSNG